MVRRDFLGCMAAAAVCAAIPPQRLTILADEAGPGPEEWIAFARKFGLTHLEMRAVYNGGQPTMMDSMSPAELKPIAQRLRDAGLKVSFFNSALLKYTLPGTTAVKSEDWYENLYKRLGLTSEKMYADREERLKRALDAAQAMGATSLRTFTFWRVAEPRSLYPRLVDLLGSMGETVRRAGCELLVETEYATNVATCEEMRDIMAMLPARNIGINWDPQNSLMLEKDVFPAGYEKLPKARIRNVQIKAAGLFGNSDGSGILDWAGIMSRLHRDGYKGLFGLETHYGSGPRNYAMSEKCMAEMQRIAATVGK